MKKILGVHPVLLAMLIIFLGLNLSEQLKSKPLDYEEYNNVLYQKPHTHQIDKDVKKKYIDSNQSKNIDIQLFNHEKWFKNKSTTSDVNKEVKKSIDVKEITLQNNNTKKNEYKKNNVTLDEKEERKDSFEPLLNIVANDKNHTDAVENHNPVATPSDVKINYLGRYLDGDRHYVFLEINGDSKAIELGSMIDHETKVIAIEQNSIQIINIRTGLIKTLHTQ